MHDVFYVHYQLCIHMLNRHCQYLTHCAILEVKFVALGMRQVVRFPMGATVNN